MFEVERKRCLPDGGERLAQRLAELGWRADEPVIEVDTYFSRPDVDFMATRECLRVRQRDGRAEVTYKPPSDAATHRSDDLISKVETNLILANGAQAAMAEQLLECIGMRRLVRVEKRRITYRHSGRPGTTVAIDTVAGVGTFVETEVLAAESVCAAELVEHVEKELDLFGYPTVDLPYRDLALDAMTP